MKKKWGQVAGIILAIIIPLSIIMSELKLFRLFDFSGGLLIRWLSQISSLFSFVVFFYLIIPTRNLYLKLRHKGYYFLSIVFGVKTVMWIMQKLSGLWINSYYVRHRTEPHAAAMLNKVSSLTGIVNIIVNYIVVPILFLLAVREFVKQAHETHTLDS